MYKTVKQTKLNKIINKVDLLDTLQILYLDNRNSTSFSNTHGTFIKTDSILGHKENISGFHNGNNTKTLIAAIKLRVMD